jgi:cellulose 1,4-beta-cellobiosidase
VSRSLLLLGFVAACAHATTGPDLYDDDTPPHAGGSANQAGSANHGGVKAATAGNAGKATSGSSSGGKATSDGGASASDGGEPARPDPTDGGEAGSVHHDPVPAGDLSLHYQAGNVSLNDNQIDPHFRLVSTGAAPIPLQQLSARYYFTSEPAPPLTVEIYGASAEGTSGYRALPAGSVKASAEAGYVELSFTEAAGLIDAGGQISVEVAIHDTGWSGLFDESDDYSFDAAHTAYAAWDKVTLYAGGELIWGIEPP